MSTRTVPQEIASGAAGRILRGIQKAKSSSVIIFPLSGVEAEVVIGVLLDYLITRGDTEPTSLVKNAHKKINGIFKNQPTGGYTGDTAVILSTLEAMATYIVLETYANDGRGTK